MNNNVFKLYASCIPVKGVKRSIICNLWKSKFRYIPDALYHILKECEGMTNVEIKKKFRNKHNDMIDSYFLFLEENEFGFYCSKDELKLFPKLNLNFEKPHNISNCIIDINEKSSFNLDEFYIQLSKLDCHYYQFRFYGDFKLSQINKILKNTTNYHIRSISIIMQYNNEIKKIVPFYNKYPITEMNFYYTPSAQLKDLRKEYNSFPFNFHSEIIKNETYCGKINSINFNANIPSFTESQHHNTCLNRKISIDVNGEIKNCPSMAISYGNVKNTTLQEVLNKKGFKDVWNINKDKIAVCKDCEFRHICLDCRAYVEVPDDIYSKPLKCGYNPYTSKWEEWSTNSLKHKAIQYYEMQELVK